MGELGKTTEPLYPLSKAAEACGVPVSTLRSWFGRGQVKLLSMDQNSSAKGQAHHVSWRTVLLLAITAELIRSGFQTQRAARLAMSFTEVGEGPQPGRSPERFPAELYEGDVSTLMVVYRDDDWAEIIAAPRDLTWRALRYSLARPTYGTPITVLDLNETVERVRSALGLTREGEAGKARDDAAPARRRAGRRGRK